MKNFVFLDCGSAAMRFYFIENDQVVQIHKEERGINSFSSRTELKTFLKESFDRFMSRMDRTSEEVAFLMASGMITSDMGLKNVPHLTAPAGANELAMGIDVLKGEDSPFDQPLLLVRGIKNAGVMEEFSHLENSDLMRGEELQALGVLEQFGASEGPTSIIELGSTTKLIEVDPQGKITGSYTALSGQTYQAIIDGTFIGGSVKSDGTEKPEGYYNETIVREAVAAVERDGFLRSVMTVRFAGVLLKKTWYERQLFYSALFAGDDKNWLIRRMSGFDSNARIYLVGNEGRCKVYKTMIGDCLDREITVVSDTAQVNRLAVDGARLLVRQYPDVIAKLL